MIDETVKYIGMMTFFIGISSFIFILYLGFSGQLFELIEPNGFLDCFLSCFTMGSILFGGFIWLVASGEIHDKKMLETQAKENEEYYQKMNKKSLSCR